MDQFGKSPSISVIMSVYNGQLFLREAVESILSQTLSDFEFIVVNDGSTDNSLSILQSYTDLRLKIINLPVNVGLAKALNIALDKASGEFVARMDADDVSLPQRFRLQVDAFLGDSALVLLGSDYVSIDDDGSVLSSVKLIADDSLLRSGLLKGNQFAHPTVMMRAEALRACGAYRDIGGRYAQDYDLWLRIAEFGKIANIGQPLLHYRLHQDQVSIKKLLSQRQTAEFYRQLALQRAENSNEDIVKAKRAVENLKSTIQEACATELLNRSFQLACRGKRSEARSLRWHAIRVAPLSRTALNVILSTIFSRWRVLWTRT